MRKNISKMPYSIRCLKAVEALVGGREELAEKIGVSHHTVGRWVHFEKISGKNLFNLSRISMGKFTADEFAGSFDDDAREQADRES